MAAGGLAVLVIVFCVCAYVLYQVHKNGDFEEEQNEDDSESNPEAALQEEPAQNDHEDGKLIDF